MSRVVVTGLGLVTSLGNDLASSWEALCQGKSGVGEITAYDTSQYRVHFGAQVKTFDPALYMERKEVRRNDPYEQLAIATGTINATTAVSEIRMLRMTPPEEMTTRARVMIRARAQSNVRFASEAFRSTSMLRTNTPATAL